jgi:hypothetical protein
MSYYGGIHLTQVTSVREALLCARLNLRGAKRLLQRGTHRRGISALYDSVLFGMHYYVARHEGCADVDLADAAGIFQLLARVGVFEDQHAFNRLSLTVERALWQGSDSFDVNALLLEAEEMLAKLGVTAFTRTTFVK